MTIQEFRDHDWQDVKTIGFRGERHDLVIVDQMIGAAAIKYFGHDLYVPCEMLSVADVMQLKSLT